MKVTQPGLSRKEIRQIMSRHRGAAFALAAEIGVSRGTVSLVLRGKSTSQRILGAARARAEQLLAVEEAAA